MQKQQTFGTGHGNSGAYCPGTPNYALIYTAD
jgi:hypothetical protein